MSKIFTLEKFAKNNPNAIIAFALWAEQYNSPLRIYYLLGGETNILFLHRGSLYEHVEEDFDHYLGTDQNLIQDKKLRIDMDYVIKNG